MHQKNSYISFQFNANLVQSTYLNGPTVLMFDACNTTMKIFCGANSTGKIYFSLEWDANVLWSIDRHSYTLSHGGIQTFMAHKCNIKRNIDCHAIYNSVQRFIFANSILPIKLIWVFWHEVIHFRGHCEIEQKLKLCDCHKYRRSNRRLIWNEKWIQSIGKWHGKRITIV